MQVCLFVLISATTVSVFCDNRGQSWQFQEKELAHKCDIQAPEDHDDDVAIYQEPHFFLTQKRNETESCVINNL